MTETLSVPTFSFVCPCYNEQAGIEQFHARLTAVAKLLNEPYEIIFVNDGSADGTADALARLAAADKFVKVVEFSRNFGHQIAVTAGYDLAAGKAVIVMDSDCQHPPEMIPELVAKWREGYEVVYTVRKDTVGMGFAKKLIIRMVYRLIAGLSKLDMTDQADFRLLDRKAVDAINQHREHARIVRGLVRHIGFRQAAIPYVAEKRAAGERTYTLRQTLGMATAGVFNFSVAPLRLAYTLGGLFMAVSALYFFIWFIAWAAGCFSPGWGVHVMMAVVGLFGVQFLLLGLVGEYVGRIFEEAKGRPLYIVRQKLNFDQPKPAVAAPAAQAQPGTYRSRTRFDDEIIKIYT